MPAVLNRAVALPKSSFQDLPELLADSSRHTAAAEELPNRLDMFDKMQTIQSWYFSGRAGEQKLQNISFREVTQIGGDGR